MVEELKRQPTGHDDAAGSEEGDGLFALRALNLDPASPARNLPRYEYVIVCQGRSYPGGITWQGTFASCCPKRRHDTNNSFSFFIKKAIKSHLVRIVLLPS